MNAEKGFSHVPVFGGKRSFILIPPKYLPPVPTCSLGSLVKKVQEAQLQQIVDTLCAYVSQEKEDLREIASIGLKTVIVQVPANSVIAVNVCKRLVPRLLSQLESVSNVAWHQWTYGTHRPLLSLSTDNVLFLRFLVTAS